MPSPRRMIRPLADFLRQEAAAGVLLVAAAAVALIWVNGPFGESYEELWSTTIQLPGTALDLDLRHWINDALMALFFLVAGMEIKREVVEGELRDPRQAALPIIGAVGGMIVPALIYAAFNAGTATSKGWGIPMATDIAIVTGVVALLSRRVPSWIGLFLLALAIVDDIGAIIVIAVFYSEGVSLGWLAAAIATVALAAVARRFLPWVPVLIVGGVACWWFLFQAEVHPTLAGVAFGLLTPLDSRTKGGYVDVSANEPAGQVSVLEWLEHLVTPWTAFLIVPLFALANAGVRVPLDTIGDALSSRAAWGVVVGLVVGKLVGIAAFTLVAVRIGLGRLPPAIRPYDVIAGAALAGIGFTVSLFVTELAFGDGDLGRDARLGVLVGSLVAALVGTALVSLGRRRPAPAEAPLGSEPWLSTGASSLTGTPPG
jgi:Na+:H+ antiporter, NhaA family